jgi:hypothetical protein
MMFPDVVSFGGLSAMTGLDLSGKFSMANIMPDNPMAFLQPFGSGMYDIGKAVGGLASNPTSPTQLARSGQQLLPGPLKPLAEKYFTDKDGNYTDPETMHGKIKRTPGDEMARYMSLRGLHESRELHKSRTIKEQDKSFQRQRAVYLDRAVDLLYEGQTMKLAKLAKDYIDAEGDPQTFMTHLKESKASQKLDAVTAMLMQSMGNPRRAKRIMEQR